MLLPASVNVAFAVPTFVVVALILADIVSVAQALGANGPHEPIDPRTLSVSVPEALKKLPVLQTT